MSDYTIDNVEPRPYFLSSTDCFLNLDAPTSPIDEHIQPFVGWFAAVHEELPKIQINGEPINNIHYYDRPDVTAFAQGRFNRAFTFYLDCARFMSADQGAITIDIFWNDRLVERKLLRVGPKILPTQERDLVAFLHMPKTGGTSLRRALEDHANTFTMLTSYDEFGFVPPADLGNLSNRALSNLDGIYGHFSFGIHRNYLRNVRYISIVRNPFDLLLSNYFFSRSNQKNEGLLAYRDIYDVMSNYASIAFCNVTTRIFAGIDDHQPVDEAALKAAIENIDQCFEFVGIAEDSQSSFRRIGNYLGLELTARVENATTYPKEFELLDMIRFRKFAREYVEYDLILYEYILRKFWGAGNSPDAKSQVFY